MTVAEIQRALLARGYDIGPAGVDGDAGPDTIAAVTAFQRMHGLTVDGIAGPQTEARLKKKRAAPPRNTPAEPGWLTLARAELGAVEGIGKSNNRTVVRYFADAGFAGIKDDETAWCAAFVGAELKRAGHKPSGSLAARSYEKWGVGLAKPALGAIATKKRAGSSWQGHVGFVVGANDKSIILLGGNQGNAVSIASFPRSEFTAFRWPAEVPVPTFFDLPATVAGAKSNVSQA